jgi:hypothetical protein
MDVLWKHLDYVIIIVAAVVLYRMLGKPLAFKV